MYGSFISCPLPAERYWMKDERKEFEALFTLHGCFPYTVFKPPFKLLLSALSEKKIFAGLAKTCFHKPTQTKKTKPPQPQHQMRNKTIQKRPETGLALCYFSNDIKSNLSGPSEGEYTGIFLFLRHDWFDRYRWWPKQLNLKRKSQT